MRKLFPVLCLFGVLSAQTPGEADPKKLGALEGQVVNALSGAPIPRAKLTLRLLVPRGQPFNPTAPYAAVSDAEGKFRIERIQPGEYQLSGQRVGFVFRAYSPRAYPAAPTTLTIAAGMETKEIQFKLTPQAILTGRVIDQDGDPMQNVNVSVVRASRSNNPSQVGVSTNDIGEFRIAGLNPGRYYLKATQQNRNLMFGELPPVEAKKTREEYVTTYWPATTEEFSARPIELSAGQTLAAIEIRMAKAEVYRIQGRVAGKPPFRNQQVFLSPRLTAQSGFIFAPHFGQIKEDGSFEFQKIMPGAHVVMVTNANGMIQVQGRASVEVAREDVTHVVITPSEPFSMQGKVRVVGGDDKPIALESIGVMLPTLDRSAFASSNANPNAEGAFTLTGIMPDKYRVRTTNIPTGFWVKSITSGGKDVMASGLDLTSGPSEPIEITLSGGVAQVTGNVQDAQREAVTGVVVAAVPDPLPNDAYELIQTANTNQAGGFTFDNLPPGDYKLYAWDGFEYADLFDPELTKAYESKARKISLKPAGRETVTLMAIQPKSN